MAAPWRMKYVAAADAIRCDGGAGQSRAISLEISLTDAAPSEFSYRLEFNKEIQEEA
jgi:hypothetical protein